MDTIVGKNGKGAIVTLTERSTNMVLFPYRNTIRLITTDNGSEFCAHRLISRALAPKGTKMPNLVFFADSYSS